MNSSYASTCQTALALNNESSLQKTKDTPKETRRGLYKTIQISATALLMNRRSALSAIWGVCIAGWGLQSSMAQEQALQIRIQLDQQAFNTVPGDELERLEVTEDTSPAAQGLKARSPPGKAIPVIYLIVGSLSLQSVCAVVQEMLRRSEYGGVTINALTSPPSIYHGQSVPAGLVRVNRADGSTETVRSTQVTEDFCKGALSPRVK